MNLQNNLITRTKFEHPDDTAKNVFQQLSYYVFCSLTGILSGVLGVALTIALTIAVQLVIFPLKPFWPEPLVVLIFAISFSAGFAWGLSKLANALLPRFFIETNGMKAVLIFATFTSLLQIFLFFPQ